LIPIICKLISLPSQHKLILTLPHSSSLLLTLLPTPTPTLTLTPSRLYLPHLLKLDTHRPHLLYHSHRPVITPSSVTQLYLHIQAHAIGSHPTSFPILSYSRLYYQAQPITYPIHSTSLHSSLVHFEGPSFPKSLGLVARLFLRRALAKLNWRYLIGETQLAMQVHESAFSCCQLLALLGIHLTLLPTTIEITALSTFECHLAPKSPSLTYLLPPIQHAAFLTFSILDPSMQQSGTAQSCTVSGMTCPIQLL
jgi:hypothetical protein